MRKKKFSELVIFGNRAYVRRMYKHLLKEHPSTRRHMYSKIRKR